MEYIQATEKDIQRVFALVQETIAAVYPSCYPEEVVSFFCQLHSLENIRRDILEGRVGLLINGQRLLGTGCHQGNHITRVYVAPAERNRGYGTVIMQYLEQEIGACYDRILLDASLPAEAFYRRRGYETVKLERCDLEHDVVFTYPVMEKKL